MIYELEIAFPLRVYASFCVYVKMTDFCTLLNICSSNQSIKRNDDVIHPPFFNIEELQMSVQTDTKK